MDTSQTTLAARRAAFLLTAAIAALAAPALGQTVSPSMPTVPLHDTNCDFSQQTPVLEAPPCTVEGARTATYNGRTRTVRNATTDFLTDSYSVAFSGALQVDGLPVTTGPAPVWPYGNPTSAGAEASYFFGSEGQSVNVNSSYTGERVQVVSTGGAGSAVSTNTPAYFSRVTNLTTAINSIDIDVDSYFETSDGGEFDFQLAAINPTAVIDNATALTGRFSGTAGSGAIQFGTLSGKATLLQGYGITPFPDETGAADVGLLSLYRLGYDVSATITTNLDETGLVTPTVTVSQGIEMNGSRITGLGAGQGPGDAVNVAQLDAATRYLSVNSTGAAAAATGVNAVAVGATASAVGENALAIGAASSVTAEAGVAIGGDSGADSNTTGARAELYATAIGTDANAAGTAAGAIGAFARATNSYATAIGFNTSANGAGSTAIGAGAFAPRDNSTAIGANTSATHAGSTAIGAGAQTTAENQLVLGNSQTAVVVAGIGASTAAQQGPVDVVTIDAKGTLGRQQAATAQSVQAVQSQMEYISAVTDSQFSALSNQVSDLSFRLDDLSRSTSGGIAAAMALGGTIIVPDSTVSVSLNASTYRGEQGYSGVVAARLGEKVYVSGGIAGSTARKSTGGRVGMAVGF